MSDQQLFDLWAKNYEESIAEHKGYPFEGYYDVLKLVYSLINKPENKAILDIGIGTGFLTKELYNKGAKITGLDFSGEMVKKAKERMPKAEFYIQDMKKGIPDKLQNNKFDYIISSYAIHHISKQEKLDLVNELKSVLNENGVIIFADVAFQKHDDLIKCKEESGDMWDNSEYYIVLEDIFTDLLGYGFNVKYTQVSNCAGVLEMKL